MSPFRELFQRNKDLAAWWNAIAHDDRFQQVLMHVRSEFLEMNLDGAQLRGAKILEAVLRSIGDNDDSMMPFPSPGLEHDLDNPRQDTTATATTKIKPKV